MTRRTEVVLTDDLSGGPATETVRFGLDGRHYEVDLSDKNAAALRRALAKYVEVGRRDHRMHVGKRKHHGDVDPRLVRQWAAENGIDVSARGRVPIDVIEQYRLV